LSTSETCTARVRVRLRLRLRVRLRLVHVGDLHGEGLAVGAQLGLGHGGERAAEAAQEAVDARLELGRRQRARLHGEDEPAHALTLGDARADDVAELLPGAQLGVEGRVDELREKVSE